MPTKPKPQPKRPAKPAAKKAATKATHKKGAWQDRFIEIFAMSLNIALAAQGAGIDRTTAYRERNRNPEFAAAWDDAKAAAIERLEAAAFERARNMSDTLLIFLLKSHKPETYRENVHHNHSGNISLTFAELANLAENGSK